MNHVAPAAIGFAASFGAAGQRNADRDRAVVGAAPDRHVGDAPVDVEDFTAWIRIGLAGGTVRPGDRRAIAQVLRHRLVARTTVAIVKSL